MQYATWHSNPNNIGSWCFNAQYCNKTNYFDGTKTPGIMGDTHTWEKGNTASTAATHQQEHQQEEAKATLHQTSPPAAATLAGVRELASLSSPWYFGAVPVENASVYASSWDTAFDPDGLGAPFGLRTAEKRNPRYFCDKKRPGAGGGCCNWSGPMWPFETAKAISAAIRVLNSYSSAHMSQEKLWTMMWQYAASHTPLWKVINTTNGEFCNLDDPHSDLKSWLLPGTQNSWIAVCMLLYRWLYRAVFLSSHSAPCARRSQVVRTQTIWGIQPGLTSRKRAMSTTTRHSTIVSDRQRATMQ